MSTCEQADDSERLILGYFDQIHDSPSHIYHSALPLSPSSSWIRECYKEEIIGEVRVLMGLPDQWDTCSRTIFLEGRPSVFEYWGDILAVGSNSNVVLLDAVTGIRTSVLCGDSGTICSLAFSPDGTFLMSATQDKVVSLWDVQTGGTIRTFCDDISVVSAASFSPDATTVALGTRDGDIHLWSVRTGKYHSIKTFRGDPVTAVKFSPIDPRRIISSWMGGAIRRWDVDGHQIGTSYDEAYTVYDLACTSDGTRFVSCGGDLARVRDSESGAVVAELLPPCTQFSSPLRRCCFSPDGRFVACTADTTIPVWDVTIPGARLVGNLIGHSNSIYFIAFSSSVVSGSCDGSVKFWKSSSPLADLATTDPVAIQDDPTPIKSVKMFAEYDVVVTSDSNGMVNTWDLMTGKCKSSFSTPAVGERDTHLEGGTLIIVWKAYGDKDKGKDVDAGVDRTKEYHIWDVFTSQLLQTFRSSLPTHRGLKISEDGSKIFGLGTDRIEAVSMQTGEIVDSVGLGSGPGGSSFFLPESQVGIDYPCYWGWDGGSKKVSYSGEFPDRPRLDLVGWSTHRYIEPCWVEDVVTKRRVFRLPERYLEFGREIEWDGRYLYNWSPSGEDMVVIDFDPVYPQ